MVQKAGILKLLFIYVEHGTRLFPALFCLVDNGLVTLDDIMDNINHLNSNVYEFSVIISERFEIYKSQKYFDQLKKWYSSRTYDFYDYCRNINMYFSERIKGQNSTLTKVGRDLICKLKAIEVRWMLKLSNDYDYYKLHKELKTRGAALAFFIELDL